MKKTSLFLAACLLVPATLFAHNVNMGGTMAQIDTMESWQAGPGTVYSHLKMTKGSKVRHMYLLTVDLTDPNITLETVIAKDHFQSYETLAAMSQRLDAPGHRMIGGINANFWCVGATIEASPNEYNGQSGMPLQGCVTNGMIGTDVTGWDRVNASHNPDSADWDIGHLALTREKKAIVCDMRGDVWIKVNETSLGIRDVNRQRTFTGEDRLTLHNRLTPNGKTPSNLCGKEVVFSVDGDWKINADMTCTVTDINTTGGTTLTGTMGALQGFNGGCNILNLLSVGSTFTLHTGIRHRHTDAQPDIMQMVAGNALIMVDGKLTGRNFNEAYNSGDYPRPVLGTNAEGNKVWLLECAPTAGMTTAEACYVLQSFGATDAGAYDGGGSAQMFVLGENKFKTTEATPRSLPLGLWVVATAPDAQEAGKLEFLNPLASIPAYASYTPTLRAWSAEGLLLSHDYKGYTLSCEPASLGTISADGMTFTANPVTESGKLIATAGTGRAETPIEIRNGEVHIVLDSVILGNRDYKVDVQAIAGDLALPLDAKALTWLSMDESRCTVNDEGILHAVANGRTQVVGSLAEFSDTLLVITEMANAPQLALSSIHHSIISSLSIDTAFSNTRTAAGVLPIEMRLWGNPDSILIVVNSDAPIQAMELTYRPNNGESDATNISGKTAENKDYTYTFATDQLMNVADQGIYPILLQSAKFTLKDPKKSKSYHFTIKDIILCYRDWAEVTALPTQLAQPAKPVKLMVNGQVYIIKNNHIYDVHGHEMK